jgi:hypothetical protein
MHQHCIHAISRRLVRASIAAAMLFFLPLASLTTVALAATASPAISALPAGSDPQLAQIIVQDNKGAPMTGAIARVLVVPQNMAANPQITEPVAGTGTIDTQGRVIASITPPAMTNAALASKDGHVNYELRVTDRQGNLLADYYFSRYYGSDPNLARETPTLSQTLLTSPRLASTLPAASAVPQGPGPNCGTSGSWVTQSETDAYTVVGELHTVTDLSGSFSYGQTADSSIGVGASSDGGSTWSVSGSVSINNTSGAKVIQGNQAASWGKQLKTEFHYLKQRFYCIVWTSYYRVVASQWDGGMQIGNDVSSGDNHPNQWKTSVPGQDQFLRSSNTAYNYSGAVCVFGVCLNARSGFSINVELHWTNTSQTTTRYLYGNNGYPTVSTIINASLN